MGKVTVTDREFFNLELISDHISLVVGTETRKLRHKRRSIFNAFKKIKGF